MKKYFLIIVLLIPGILLAQSPKREMRSSWLATVWGIDWPQTRISSTGNESQIQRQKDEMTGLLDLLVASNMNAVCFQIRSRCDAMYRSSYEPWSSDLVAERGMDPGYDPLQFVIEEGHKRGLEVYAWMNPYRFESVAGQWAGMPGDYNETNPDWVLTYPDGGAILNPGCPEVVHRIKCIIGEVVTDYDVDGVLFDDYFYAYGGTPATLDSREQELYKPDDMSLSDWRRKNVNRMVSEVYDTIQQIKPYVTFGVSPFGIWTTNIDVAREEGLDLPSVTGGNMYEEIYCDPVAWLKEGTVDFISPQLYWTTDGRYTPLCPWWSEICNRFGKHFYSSHTLQNISSSSYAPDRSTYKSQKRFRIGEEEVGINSISGIELASLSDFETRSAAAVQLAPEEIGAQIEMNRATDKNGAPGSIFYSTKYLKTKGFANYLSAVPFSAKALVPAVHWKEGDLPEMPADLTVIGSRLSWKNMGKEMRYSVYAVPRSEATGGSDFCSAKWLQGMVYSPYFDLPASIGADTHVLAVAAFDRYGNESSPAVYGQSVTETVTTTLLSPQEGQRVIMPFTLDWEKQPAADYYILEIAEDREFTRPVCRRELSENSFSTTLLDALQEQTYYWRVRCRRTNAYDGLSDIRSFTVARFTIHSPEIGQTGVSLTPVIEWQALSDDAEYRVEIATYQNFLDKNIIFSQTVRGINSLEVPAKILIGYNTYYVRVITTVEGTEVVSPTVSFATGEFAPAVPTILSPVDGSTITGADLKITWNEDVASGYRVELCKDDSFGARQVKVKSTDAYVFETEYTNLEANTYYIRLRASYANTFTGWSDVIRVTVNSSAALTEAETGDCFLIVGDSKDVLVLNAVSDAQPAKITVFALSGKEVSRMQVGLNSGKNMISLPDSFSCGIYLIKIETAGLVKTLKWVKH